MDEKLITEIKDEYGKGASPLQLARRHNLEVEQIYLALDKPEMLSVAIVGDQIDNAGLGVQINGPSLHRVNYSKN